MSIYSNLDSFALFYEMWALKLSIFLLGVWVMDHIKQDLEFTPIYRTELILNLAFI